MENNNSENKKEEKYIDRAVERFIEKPAERFICNLTTSKYKKLERFIGRLGAIIELSVRNEVPILQTANVYAGSNNKIYSSDLSIIGRIGYDENLERKTFELAERYFDIMDVRKLKYLALINGVQFKYIKPTKNLLELIEKTEELEDLMTIDEN